MVHALSDVDLVIGRGELLVVRGRSGSGKTSLLNLLGGLDRPTRGVVVVDGHEISAMNDDELVEVRRRTIAFIYQAFGLIPFLSTAENVEVPLRLVGTAPRARDRRVRELLDLVGIGGRATIARMSCPAASSSASRSPGPSRIASASCSPTSRRASSTSRRAIRSCS